MGSSPITTSFTPEAQLPPRTTPPPKPPTTVATTTLPPVPKGFPSSIPIPAGAETGFYTGSAQLGFHLSLSTGQSMADLVTFFTTELAAAGWELGVRDVGRGFLPGYEDQWAIYTGGNHVLTQISGEFGAAYSGVLEVEGRHVTILLDPEQQPPDGEDPEILPLPPELPRPEPAGGSAEYNAGVVRMRFVVAPDVFETLLAAYRERNWDELALRTDTDVKLAVGDLAGWRVTIRDFTGTDASVGMTMDFENRELSYP